MPIACIALTGWRIFSHKVKLERTGEVDRSIEVDTGAVVDGWIAVTELVPTAAAPNR